VSDSTGRQLLGILRRELLTALHDAVAGVVGDLGALEVDRTFDGTPFAGRVLTPAEVDNPVLAWLAGFTDSAGGGGAAGAVQARLRGWRDEATDGAPRGIAYVVSDGGTAVAALSVVPGGANPTQAVLRAAGFGAGQSIDVALGNGFGLRVRGVTSADEIEVVLSPDQPPVATRLAAGDRVDIDLDRPSQGERLGLEGGPELQLGSVSAGGWVANGPSAPFDGGGHLRLEKGLLVLAPGFLKGLLPLDLDFPLDLDLKAAPGTGVVLAGSPSLRTRLAGTNPGRWLDLALDLVDVPGASGLDVSFRTAVNMSLPGLPLDIRVDGVGLKLPIGLDPGAPLFPQLPAGLLPEGAGVAVDLPVVRGAGVLGKVGDDLAGALAVQIPPMSASAFGVLSPPRDGHPLSFLVIMGATFPPPGVQVGFGVAISGIGGVVGINRRIDREALLRAVTDGSVAQLLFPSDPVGAGEQAIRALPAVFPEARGSVVAGPMFQLSWGGRIVTMSVAVLVESSTHVRLTIMGKIVVALPDPAAPLVLLQASFAGFVDSSEPSALFVASLTGSHIVGAPLSGDLMLLARGGSDPQLVLSAGGFHPSYPLPRGVPALDRISMDLCPSPWIDLRCENYFAVTSNTLQLGARLELVAEVAGCGLRGWLEFDALVQYSPFRFMADMSAGIALRAFGETLVGIALALHLEGPSPYLARGRGSIDLFLFEVSFDFEVGWGSPAPAAVGAFDVGDELRRALAEPAAWRPRGAAPPGLVLTDAAQKLLADAAAVDPYGTLAVRQERVPLGIEIQRFAGLPVPPQRWDIEGGQFADGEPDQGHPDIRAQFAPGQFLAPPSDDAALTTPAFVPLKAGVELHPAPAQGAEARAVGLRWEERVLSRDVPRPLPLSAGVLVDIGDLEALLAAQTAGDDGWWGPPEEVITIDPVAPVASAFSWSMAPGPAVDAATGLEMDQAVAAIGDLMTVEAWEVGG
jgi:hypothetical protein